MKHLAAYMLLVLAGNDAPSEAQVTKLLKDSGVAVEKDALASMMKLLEGKKVHELVGQGRGKFASMPAAGAGGAPAQAAPADAKKEDKKEEKKPEEEEDDGLDGAMDLFG